VAQVEYLVVTYKDDEEKVTLSLRQADILTALAEDEKLCSRGGVVPALQDINSSW
jgi:glutamate--cysteine ligase catalytic subunit